MRILCSGDLHIGRRSSRVPAACQGSCAAAWDRIVGLAIRRRADLVVLSGDVVDQDAAFYEAYGALERGLTRLAREGIPVYAIKGNHDYDSLPQLACQMDQSGMYLLGPDGGWGAGSFPPDGPARLRLLGWSFPERTWEKSPLEDFPGTAKDGVPTLAVVHGTLASGADMYAPLRADRLQAHSGVSAWLLGHKHRPDRVQEGAGAPVLNPGSPQAMDPGEEGIHGPWELTLTGGQPIRMEQHPLSTAVYLDLGVDVGGVTDQGELARRVEADVCGAIAGHPRPDGVERAFSVRVTLTGRCADTSILHRERERILTDPGWLGGDILLDRLDIDVQPEHDLQALAGTQDAAGGLARMLLALDGRGTLEPPDVLSRAADAVHGEWLRGAYKDIAEDAEPDPARLVRAEAVRLLDALLRQKGPKAECR